MCNGKADPHSRYLKRHKRTCDIPTAADCSAVLGNVTTSNQSSETIHRRGRGFPGQVASHLIKKAPFTVHGVQKLHFSSSNFDRSGAPCSETLSVVTLLIRTTVGAAISRSVVVVCYSLVLLRGGNHSLPTRQRLQLRFHGDLRHIAMVHVASEGAKQQEERCERR